jgi:hypothetical protein
MKRFLILTTAFVFAGISFAQQTQSDGSREQNPAGSPKHQHRMEWCKQNWEKCKQVQLKMLSAKKECLEKSQDFEAFRSCMAQFREQRKHEMKEMKKEEMKQ